ncbi:hypothetical protein GCM10010275_46710 [Streptomyces litmocidini]|nr:hypothetical protein GCM10010275_46710 [Streptomyces litmocidini]
MSSAARAATAVARDTVGVVVTGGLLSLRLRFGNPSIVSGVPAPDVRPCAGSGGSLESDREGVPSSFGMTAPLRDAVAST